MAKIKTDATDQPSNGAQADDPLTQPDVPAAIFDDQNAGLGGSYLLDPVSGLRQLVQRTEPDPNQA
ncbi:hypothetical protein [Chitinimonas sp.]|uniref:hypothetical protein n=1 Tax=Chitinimonas sp. TaxID=1934313 RepID=UPI0035AFC748